MMLLFNCTINGSDREVWFNPAHIQLVDVEGSHHCDVWVEGFPHPYRVKMSADEVVRAIDAAGSPRQHAG